uniref:Cilia- and flagella-associated protein 157 n=1 Tax=Craspedostauros australis TaxID=1486917 RepID=A0A7R9ZRR6_9STRA
MERIKAINTQLRELDEENQKLQQEFTSFQDVNLTKLKQKDEQVTELLDELTRLKREMESRKEADYVNLLNDKKQLKKDHAASKKELRSVKQKLVHMNLEMNDMEVERQDMLADIEALKKSFARQSSKDYLTSLKRQISSLKTHNKALERKLDYEKSASKKSMGRKDETIAFLQKQLTVLKTKRVSQQSPRKPGAGKKQLWSMLTPLRMKKDKVSIKARQMLIDDKNEIMTDADSDFDGDGGSSGSTR